MKCCTLPDGAEDKGGHKKGHGHRGRGSLLAKAAKHCKGKTKSAFRKCVSATIKKLKR